MARAIARVSGVALRPGISKNNRQYTRAAIAKMVARAQDRLESGGTLALTDRTGPAPEPIGQLTHHDAGDDTTHLIGAVRRLSLDEDGAARFIADIADTPHGRTIASLLDTSDGEPPFLRNVSIRAGAIGDVQTFPGKSAGEVVSSFSDLELLGLDYTSSPGVPGAQVDHFEWVGGQRGPGESADGRVLITESVLEAHVTAITEETPAAEVAPPAAPAPGTAPAPGQVGIGGELAGQVRETLRHVMPAERAHTLANGLCVTCAPAAEGGNAPGDGSKPYGDVSYADPGYQSDRKKRYPIDSASHVKAALAYLAQKANAAKYSAAQLKRVMGRIRGAAKRFGITVSAEGWTIEPAYQVTESVLEWMGDAEAGSRAGSWCVNASNGPVSINLSSYCMDPDDLDVILRAAADAACKALAALDPDMDGDVDVPGAGPGSDTDQDHGRETYSQPAAALGEAADPDPDPEPDLEIDAPEPPASESVPAPEATTDPAPEPAAATEKEKGETGMSESTTQTAAGTAPAVETQPPAPAAPGGVTLTDGQFATLLEALRPHAPAQAAPVAEAVPAAPPAPAPAPVAPAAPAPATVTEDAAVVQQRIDQMVDARLRAILAENKQPAPVEETDEARMARLVEARVTERMQAMVASGEVAPTRAGLAPGGPVDEHRGQGAGGETLNPETGLPTSWPGGGGKPLHQYSSEELAQYTGPVLDHHVMRGRAVTTLR